MTLTYEDDLMERLNAQRQIKADRIEMKTSATKFGVVCKGGCYSTNDPEDIIAIAKGWKYEHDLAEFQGRHEEDNIITASFYSTYFIPREFTGDEDRSEHRMYATTLIMLREFSKVKMNKEGEFMNRFVNDKLNSEGDVIQTVEEREQESMDSVCYQDCRDLRDDTEKLSRFRQFFGTATKMEIQKAMEATHGDTYYALIKAILKVDGNSAFARYTRQQREKKITAEDIRSGKVDIKHAAQEQVRQANLENEQRVKIIHALEHQGREDIAARKTRMVKEAQARFAAKQLEVVA